MANETAMLITVGTGIGTSQDVRDSLAHGILYAINHYNPKRIVFFGSDESLKTVESLKRQYMEKHNRELDFSEFIEISEVDNFKKYFTAIKSKIDDLEDEYNIIVDYTSGTKTMTMSAAFASMLYHKKLIFVSGEREGGLVLKGTEEIKSQNLYLVYDELMTTKIKELFNSNRFEAGKVLIDDIVGSKSEKEAFTKLFNSYSSFDNVNYVNVLENFDLNLFVSVWPDLEKDFQKNMKALNILNVKNHGQKCYYVLASLLNNARRRSEEHKYDDAIARLYRCLELIAQIKLKEYDIKTSDVDLNILKEKGIKEDYINEFRSNSEGKIKIGLTQDYILLNELNDNLGNFYIENEKVIQNLLKYRNQSILAHGLDSQDEDQYCEFRQLVLKAANVLNPNIDNFIDETIFPEFEI